VHLGEGRLVAALDPLGPGQRFTVDTVLGSVTAVGTVFAVECYEGRVWVTVLEGRVELRDPSVRVLGVGERTSMRGEIRGDEPSPVEVTPSALAQLVGLATLLRAAPGAAQLSIPTQGELSLHLDGHALGGGLMDLSLAAGAHELAVFDDHGELLDQRTLTLDALEPFDLAGVLASLDSTPDGQARVAPNQPIPSANQLAEAAQRERAAGHHAQTASLYRALLEHYPDSPEAVNVPVRLGDLLASTGDHEGALQAYDLYVERGAKQLAPEAELGRVMALRALGRRADEAAAITAYLSAWPDDHRRPELQARLAQL
jgi:tetratricopeptide (TPR) repeat protein